MSTRDPRLDKIYAFKTKDPASLRTWDIEGRLSIISGARSMKRIRERRDPVSHASTANGPSAAHSVFKSEEFNPLRNPGHYTDTQNLESHGVHLPASYDERSRQKYTRPTHDKTLPREPRQNLNTKEYKDSLENFVEQSIPSRGLEGSDVRASMPNLMRRQQQKRDDEQTQFMQQAMSNNILLKRDAETFFGEGSSNTAAGFVRNYNEFYRGSTPDDKLSRSLAKRDSSYAKPPPPPKKKDIFLYDFIVNKPKLIYKADEFRLKNEGSSIGKYLNSPAFKNSVTAFFGVDEEFPKPEYSKRGPIQRPEDVTSLNRVYGGKVPFHL